MIEIWKDSGGSEGQRSWLTAHAADYGSYYQTVTDSTRTSGEPLLSVQAERLHPARPTEDGIPVF